MSDEVKSTTVPAGTPVNINVSSPAREDFKGMSEKQFTERLKEAEEAGVKRLLKDLGIEKKDRKAALEEIREGRMALSKKEQEVKAAKAEAEALKPKVDAASKRTAELENELKAYVDDIYNNAPENVQKFIAATTSDDVAARMKALRAAKEAGLFTPTQAFAAKEAAKPVVEAKPANPATTMAPDGPAAPKTPGTLNHYETWMELKKSGQTVLAAQFYSKFDKTIEAQRK